MMGILQSLSALSLTASIILIIVAAIAAIGAINALVCIVLVTPKPKKKPAKEERAPKGPKPEKKREPVEEKPAAPEVQEKVEPVAEEKPAEEPVQPVQPAEPIAEDKPVNAAVINLPAAPEGLKYVQIRYNKSFTARLIQSPDSLKDYYTIIKNELLRYKGVKSRISWKHETFRKGRKLLAKMKIRGKTLCLYLALDAENYAGTKYKVEDVSHVNSNAEVPALYRIKNDRRCRYSKYLISEVMRENGLTAGEELHEDYKAQYPYEPLQPLIDRKLVKILKWDEKSAGSEIGVIAVPETAVIPEARPYYPEQVVTRNGKMFLRVRYNRSYTAKLIQSGDNVKDYYTIIKNEILGYKGVKSRISWKHETFKKGRNLLIRLAVRGKTLCMYIALNAADYAGTKYKVEDVSHVSKNAEVPALYRIKNDRRCKYAKDLIAAVMEKQGLENLGAQAEDYKAQYPYEPLQPLIDRKLVKLLEWDDKSAGAEVGIIEMPAHEIPREELLQEVSAEQAEEIQLEDIKSYEAVSEKYSDRTKKGIVNIDTLDRYFKAGEKVTLEEMKKRIPEIGKKTTYIKVLARGTLSKALTVEADDYSPAATKMIILTGGMAIRKR